MLIFPAIDLYGGKAVRLYKGDYNQMTVYNDNPLSVAEDFRNQGATCLHIVDLEGAKTGETPNIETVKLLAKESGLFTEIGGGIRNIETADKYIEAGVDRIILGTAAVKDEAFLIECVKKYGDKVAVGADLKDGYVAIKGWTEKSEYDAYTFCEKMQKIGVKTLIITDISKDGAMQGTNLALYKELSEKFNIDITASGGVSTIDDVKKLSEMNMYAAIIGKAYYTGAISIKEAVEVAK
ncbi:MAG: 1-(5-phosphoribosyl)-5-[(5-phosphoribosylamino)methylideneamino]imidazole-4-carboxamide isomerase [Clostridia bacterium]|nr:1-(5-phosphoribosyl)-5-[(5-phosphoribosylamino)methylideneamino]imidazole-4-carboxamide isomerase [Clostridia bacterium]